jgi:hypothetical protein
MSFWFILMALIPFINLYFFFMMVFKRGDDFENEHGLPRANDLVAHLLAWSFPIMFIV